MNEKEIEYCLKQFEENKQAYMFGNGLIISFYDVFKQLKDLQKQKEELKKWLEEILNELKENDIYDRTSYEIGQIAVIESIIAKIEELEEGVK